jgi:DNA-binding transcriptional ArsR family regulator
MALSPTLWRTCRVLSGATRLSLFRRLAASPGQSVSELAAAEKISRPRASQELRRLQSRGLVGVERMGRYVRYYPKSDPLVSSARPILTALQKTCAQSPSVRDVQMARMARGLSHPKRMDIVCALRRRPLDFQGLCNCLQMPGATLCHHLAFLDEGGWVVRSGRQWKLVAINSPLAKCLLKRLPRGK